MGGGVILLSEKAGRGQRVREAAAGSGAGGGIFIQGALHRNQQGSDPSPGQAHGRLRWWLLRVGGGLRGEGPAPHSGSW